MSKYDEILIENYEVEACHGVNPEEKINRQRFLASAIIYTDFTEAAKNDDIDKTISYSAVCKYIKSFLSENCFNLLETIAERLACGILGKFDGAEAVRVSIKKPDAPMKGVFDHVGVSVFKKWTQVYLSLGSNMGDRDKYLDFALSEIGKREEIKDLESSRRYFTEPYGGAAKGEFINCAAGLKTYLEPFQLLDVLHAVEIAGGRERGERWGDRTLDIDVLFYGDEIIGEKMLAIPHPDIENRLFVLEPLFEIAPNFVNPLSKERVCETLRKLKTIPY